MIREEIEAALWGVDVTAEEIEALMAEVIAALIATGIEPRIAERRVIAVAERVVAEHRGRPA